MGWAEQQLEILKPNYAGQWDLWIVHRYRPPGVIWCAKPAGTALGLLHADTPEHLIEYIAEAEGDDHA
jgi:hypothetical protein